MIENELSKKIIGCAIEVHKQLGPGLLESAYQECLFYELKQSVLKVQKEKPMPIIYKDVKRDHGYRIDLLVDEKVVVENELPPLLCGGGSSYRTSPYLFKIGKL